MGTGADTGAVVGTPRRRGRRPRTEAAVLAATTRLLETASLSQLSVAQILDAAGVGRTSFYEHFSSKEDVLVKLVRSVSVEIGDELQSIFARERDDPPRAFRTALTHLVTMSERYGPLMLAATEEWPAIPGLARLWFAMHADLTERVAAIVVAERAAGRAPAGADPTALAACLVWATERALHVVKAGDVPALSDHTALVEPLVQLYVATIYGRPPQPV